MKLYKVVLINLIIVFIGAIPLYSQTGDYQINIPRISNGKIINGGNYYGLVDIECSYSGEIPFAYTDKEAFYSLDAGATWFPAKIKDNAIRYSVVTRNDYVNESNTALLPDKEYVVCWSDKIFRQGTNYYNVYFQVVAFNGSPVSEKIIVNSEPSSIPIVPKIASLSDNGFVIIWSVYNGTENTLVGKKFSHDGAVINEEFEIKKYSNIVSANNWSVFSDYRITSVSDRGFVVTWTKGSTDAGEWDLEGSSFDEECVPMITGVQIEHSPVLNYRTIGLTDGAFLISWPVLMSDNEVSIVSRVYDNILSIGDYNKCTEYTIDLGNTEYSRTSLGFPAPVTCIRVDNLNIIEQRNEKLVYSWIRKNELNFPIDYSVVTRCYDLAARELSEEKLLFTSGNIKYAVLANYNDAELIAFYLSENIGKIILMKYDENEEADYNSIFYNYSSESPTFIHDIKLQTLDNNQFLLSSVKQDEQNLEHEVSFINGDKTIYAGNLNPATDLAIRCKIVDPGTNREWVSEIRHYLYANPLDGKNGSIDYENGFTRNSTGRVTINLPNGRYQGMQLFKKEAVYVKNESPLFGEWSEYGKQSTLDRYANVTLEDGKCYQFKLIVRNNADFEYEYANPNVIICDQSPPRIDYSTELNGFNLLLELDIQDNGIGIGVVKYRVNNKPYVDISGRNEIVLILENGPNHIEIKAGDLLENYNSRHIFQPVTVTIPEIYVYGIEEGDTYGEDIRFKYSSNIDVTNVIAYLNNEPIGNVRIFNNQSQTDTLNDIVENNTDIVITGNDINGNATKTHMQYIDGSFLLDLKDLHEGPQLFGISALDAGGTKVEKKIGFFLDQDYFNFTILSPQAREYETNTVSLDYWSSKPLRKVWYALNDENASDERELEDLPDGKYELVVYAQDENDVTVSKRVDFSVKQAMPWINLIQPVDGQIFSTKEIDVVCDTNAEISYTVDGKTGELSSGMKLHFETDGEYVLYLTAVYPASGNTINRSIRFRIDTVSPDLEIIMPQSGIYAHKDFSIQYRTNKPLAEVNYSLNGVRVDRLENLPVGNHEFTISGNDQSGRTVKKTVSFSVITLEIVTPLQNEKIVTDDVFPTINFTYLAEGNYQLLTQDIDKAEPRLVADPPGIGIPIKTKAGTHDLNLYGHINEHIVGKKRHFQIGIKNLTVTSGSIDYSYISNTDPVNESTDTIPTLKIYNTGDVDISESIPVRFDHVSTTGDVNTQIVDITNIPVGKFAMVILESVNAKIGDRFIVSIDPEDEIKGEWKGDNGYSVVFQTAQITGVRSKFSADDEYLEDVSLFDIMEVDTAGPVAYVEFQTNSKIFVDNTPENGFISYVDLGLLSVENNYVKINAVGENGIVLDSHYYYFKIQRLKKSMQPTRFPWSYFTTHTSFPGETEKERIVMSEIDLSELLNLQLTTTHRTMMQTPSVQPVITEENRVNYQVTTKATSKDQSDIRLNSTNVPLTNGYYDIPKGQSYLLFSTYDPNEGVCINLGALPIDENTDAFEKIAKEAFERAKANLQELVNKVNGWLYQLENEEYLIKYALDMLNENVLSSLGAELDVDVDQNDDLLFIHWKNVVGLIGDLFQLDLPDWLDNVLGVYYYGVFKFTIKEELKIDVGDLDLDVEFDGKICLVCDENNEYNLVGDARLDINFSTEANIQTPGIEFEMDGFIGISILDVLLPPLIHVTGDLELYSINVNIPMSLKSSVRLLLEDNVLTVSPFVFSFHQSTYYSGKLFRASASAQLAPFYAPFLTGIIPFSEIMPLFALGASGEAKGKITMEGRIATDLIASIDENFYPDYDFFYYLYGYIHPVIKVKWSVDLLIFGFIPVTVAGSGGWKTVYDEEISGSIGSEYTQEEVEQAIIDHTMELPLNDLL